METLQSTSSVAVPFPPHTAQKIPRNLKTHSTKHAVLPLLCFDCHVLCGGETNQRNINTKHMAVFILPQFLFRKSSTWHCWCLQGEGQRPCAMLGETSANHKTHLWAVTQTYISHIDRTDCRIVLNLPIGWWPISSVVLSPPHKALRMRWVTCLYQCMSPCGYADHKSILSNMNKISSCRSSWAPSLWGFIHHDTGSVWWSCHHSTGSESM